MYSFTVHAVGNLARDPEQTRHAAGTSTRVCLMGNDPAGKDEQGHLRETVTSVRFVAFDALGDTIARHARKGDQLIVLAQIRSHTWTDPDGTRRHDHSYVIRHFRFGAPGRVTRDEFAAREAQAPLTPF